MEVARNRALHVLQAPGLSLAPGRDEEALLRVLLWLTDGIRLLIIDIEGYEKAREKYAASKAVGAVELASPLQSTPPTTSIGRLWRENEEKSYVRPVPPTFPGNPGRITGNALLLLCSFYRFAFGLEPSTNKPTFIFVETWFDEYSREMMAATEEVRPSKRRKSRSVEWRPKRDALRKALPEYFRDFVVDRQIHSQYHDQLVFDFIRQNMKGNEL